MLWTLTNLEDVRNERWVGDVYVEQNRLRQKSSRFHIMTLLVFFVWLSNVRCRVTKAAVVALVLVLGAFLFAAFVSDQVKSIPTSVI